MRTVAALYVDEDGVYSDISDVEVWGVNRDARSYPGPHPVVAHPPCERWGAMWYLGPKERDGKGDDDGCFEAALAAVERWGGVVEHPAHSAAWDAFLLPHPGEASLFRPGFTVATEQGYYGHPAPKSTWLYIVGLTVPPALPSGPSGAMGRIGTLRPNARSKGGFEVPKSWRRRTPVPFRDLLLDIARRTSFRQPT